MEGGRSQATHVLCNGTAFVEVGLLEVVSAAGATSKCGLRVSCHFQFLKPLFGRGRTWMAISRFLPYPNTPSLAAPLRKLQTLAISSGKSCC